MSGKCRYRRFVRVPRQRVGRRHRCRRSLSIGFAGKKRTALPVALPYRFEPWDGACVDVRVSVRPVPDKKIAIHCSLCLSDNRRGRQADQLAAGIRRRQAPKLNRIAKSKLQKTPDITRVAKSVFNGIRGRLSKKETLNGRPARLICPPGSQIRNARNVERLAGMTPAWTRMTCNLSRVQSKRTCHRIRPRRRAQVMQVPNPQT